MFDDKTSLDPTGLRSRVADILSRESILAEAIGFEAILADVQAELSVIPRSAADEIVAAANSVPSVEHVVSCREKVGHPMVAILDAFSKNLSPHAAEWLHYGTTTADVFRTIRMIQTHRIADMFIDAMSDLECTLAELARSHRDLPMVGRTLGRHALPTTFGYKASVWMVETRRNIERLIAWKERYPSGAVSGAIGTHAAMGEIGPKVEQLVLQKLGLGAPDVIDSKGSTDVFADFGSTLAIAARICGRIAQEIFLLQGDDIREVSQATHAVGSSTMPHKSNPTLCIEVMSRSREVAAALPVLLEWILIIHERDSAQHGSCLETMCIDMAQVLSCIDGVLGTLVVHPVRMLHNLHRTKGAILTEQLTVQLSASMGRRSAHEVMRDVVSRMKAEDLTLSEAVSAEPSLSGVSVPNEAEAIGLAPQMVDEALARLGYDAASSTPMVAKRSR